MILSITTLCHYAECHYAECNILLIITLNDSFYGRKYRQIDKNLQKRLITYFPLAATMAAIAAVAAAAVAAVAAAAVAAVTAAAAVAAVIAAGAAAATAVSAVVAVAAAEEEKATEATVALTAVKKIRTYVRSNLARVFLPAKFFWIGIMACLHSFGAALAYFAVIKKVTKIVA